MTKVPTKAILAILGALLYGASPIDLVPDLIPMLGLVDDAIVIPILLLTAIVRLRARKAQPAPVRIKR